MLWHWISITKTKPRSAATFLHFHGVTCRGRPLSVKSENATFAVLPATGSAPQNNAVGTNIWTKLRGVSLRLVESAGNAPAIPCLQSRCLTCRASTPKFWWTGWVSHPLRCDSPHFVAHRLKNECPAQDCTPAAIRRRLRAKWRRVLDLHQRIEVLQTSALLLG
jgi:hypothetical protein